MYANWRKVEIVKRNNKFQENFKKYSESFSV